MNDKVDKNKWKTDQPCLYFDSQDTDLVDEEILWFQISMQYIMTVTELKTS